MSRTFSAAEARRLVPELPALSQTATRSAEYLSAGSLGQGNHRRYTSADIAVLRAIDDLRGIGIGYSRPIFEAIRDGQTTALIVKDGPVELTYRPRWVTPQQVAELPELAVAS